MKSWFEANGRHLPWRSLRDPYRVWLSEIMLQQTTVAAVVPYFERFLQRFPTLADLARAEEADVLRQWEGLGYYSRARNLHAAAQRVMQDHGGSLPADVATLRTLPGIGRYTAGAIASFAFNQPAAIVEANTQRLHARLLGEDRDLKSAAAQKALWQFAESLVATPSRANADDGFGPAEINQALMDLGATVCTPTAPDCLSCPVQRWCRAFAQKRQHEIPKLPVRPAITHLDDVSVAIRHRDAYLLRRRQPGERWAGLWDFPRFTIPSGRTLVDFVEEGVLEQTGLKIGLGLQVAEFQHGVTRYRITLKCFLATVAGGQLNGAGEMTWAAPSTFDKYALSVTGRKFAQRLQNDRLLWTS